MLIIGTPRLSQISLTQDMSSNEEVLSNSIAFMKHPQDGKAILLYFAEKEKKKEIREKKEKEIPSFRVSDSAKHPSLENEQQQKPTALPL